MNSKNIRFDEREVLNRLRHYLPSQAPLKDFIHHNTLHAFQHLGFHDAQREASTLLGYKTYLQLEEYRTLYKEGRIRDSAIIRAIHERQGEDEIDLWKNKMTQREFDCSLTARIGSLRNQWKTIYQMNLDKMVHPTLFRLLNSYLDQGIAIHPFPVAPEGFMASVRNLNKNSFMGLLHSKRTNLLLNKGDMSITYLLSILVGDESLYENYLFDQQFAHPGWSGMVSVLEENPDALFDPRKISLSDLIKLELIMEIDAMDTRFGENWEPVNKMNFQQPAELFKPSPENELSEILALWQEAFEWSYYPEILKGIQNRLSQKQTNKETSFHALLCIDDRECSFRRYIEHQDPQAKTYGTPGFFNVEFYYKPEHSRFHSKVCPVPVSPKYEIRETDSRQSLSSDPHYAKNSHSLLTGWVISQTLGFWSALKLFFNIFKPSLSPATSYSFRHMDHQAHLLIENPDQTTSKEGLRLGYTTLEMADRVEGLLKSIGLIKIDNTIVYAIGHGASSVNNTHYAAYDCGACAGRPGSVNARVISDMGNRPEVRKILESRGIKIHEKAVFIGALHDTTRDEIQFYDLDQLDQEHQRIHSRHVKTFEKALQQNAKERARRFILNPSGKSGSETHEAVKRRSVSLFEPRPELNHATNALCIIGRRELTYGLFLDRRAFLNSYDYRIDPDGKHLLAILKAATPVCGGINLEYYYSRVDNQKLGAGSKLSHNVMGLIGVANGTDGDLRTGLPWQMVEVHDPLRMMFVIEQYPDTVKKVIEEDLDTYEWFINHWLHLIVVNPENHRFYRFRDGIFSEFILEEYQTLMIKDLNPIIEQNTENLPVYILEA